jgi:hypothetical protein
MANPEHLDVIVRDVREWNRWTKTLHTEAIVDLARAALATVDLREANLHRTALRGANLAHANLSHALRNAGLTTRTLTGASLRQADASAVFLVWARLRGAAWGRPQGCMPRRCRSDPRAPPSRDAMPRGPQQCGSASCRFPQCQHRSCEP